MVRPNDRDDAHGPHAAQPGNPEPGWTWWRRVMRAPVCARRADQPQSPARHPPLKVGRRSSRRDYGVAATFSVNCSAAFAAGPQASTAHISIRRSHEFPFPAERWTTNQAYGHAFFLVTVERSAGEAGSLRRMLPCRAHAAGVGAVSRDFVLPPVGRPHAAILPAGWFHFGHVYGISWAVRRVGVYPRNREHHQESAVRSY